MAKNKVSKISGQSHTPKNREQLKTQRKYKKTYLIRFFNERLVLLNEIPYRILVNLRDAGETTVQEIASALKIRPEYCRLLLIILYKRGLISRDVNRDGSLLYYSYWVEEEFCVYEPEFII